MTFKGFVVLWCVAVFAYLMGWLDPAIAWADEFAGANITDWIVLGAFALHAVGMVLHFHSEKSEGRNPFRSNEPFFD